MRIVQKSVENERKVVMHLLKTSGQGEEHMGCELAKGVCSAHFLGFEVVYEV